MKPLGVVVHCLSLAASDEELAVLNRLLSEDECQRAAVFRFDEHRRRSIIARARLRIVLAAHAGGAPQDLRFAYGPHGKPWLPALPSLRFNVAHAGDRALVAIAHGREVGIDLERVEPRRDLADVARQFFSAAERQALDGLEASLRQTAILRCWCRKEAYVKARGGGLTRPLDSFDVAIGPLGDARSLLVATRPDPSDAGEWLVRDVALGPGWASALAVDASAAGAGNDRMLLTRC